MSAIINRDELLSLAEMARKRSHCPYSNISVGAALLTKSGRVFVGANIENASFTPTVCAERVAFFKAISEGEREFSAIAIVGGKHGNVTDMFMPCGVCRQVMAEFCDDDFEIIVALTPDDFKSFTLKELLPFGFSKNNVTVD